MKIQELVKKHDPQNQFNVLRESYKQIETAWNNKINLSMIDVSEINNIIEYGNYFGN